MDNELLSNELTPEETTDPVLDMTMMQHRIDELQEKVDELEYGNMALQDHHRVDLMSHLLPPLLAQGMGRKSAIKEAISVADECIGIMTEGINKKAAEYRKLIEEQRTEREDKRALIELTEGEPEN